MANPIFTNIKQIITKMEIAESCKTQYGKQFYNMIFKNEFSDIGTN